MSVQQPTPQERLAIQSIARNVECLKQMGWRDICYGPKDGTQFLAIEAGSTGVHVCHHYGEWPHGAWFIESGHDIWPSHPILFKPMPKVDKQQDSE